MPVDRDEYLPESTIVWLLRELRSLTILAVTSAVGAWFLGPFGPDILGTTGDVVKSILIAIALFATLLLVAKSQE